MSDTGRIKVDYDKCLAQANRLDELSKKCDEQSNKMNKLIGKLQEVWLGASGNAMADKCREWMVNQLQQGGKLYLEAKAIRRVVYELQEAERKAIEKINAG